jgi:hypothetical protein
MFRLVLVLGGLFLSHNALSAEYYVTEVAGTGIEDSLRATTRELVKTAVVESGENLVLDSKLADYLLRPKVLKLGSSLVVNVTKQEGSSVVYSARAKASNIEELDVVVLRVTRAAIRGKKVSKDIQVGEVTDKEQKEVVRRKEALSLKYFGFGPSYYGWGDNGLVLAFGGVSEVSTDWAIRYMGNFGYDTVSANTSLVAFNIGAQRYLSAGTFAPYFHGGLGYGLSFGDDLDSSVNDFSYSVGVGMTLFRTSNRQLDVSLGYTEIMTEATRAGESEKLRPSVLALQLGFMY